MFLHNNTLLSSLVVATHTQITFNQFTLFCRFSNSHCMSNLVFLEYIIIEKYYAPY